MSAVYSVDQLFGFRAYAKNKAAKYKNVSSASYDYAQPGEYLGVVYSYIERNGKLYLQIENGNSFFVEWKDIDTDKFKKAGVKSDAQLAKEKAEADMPWYERLISKYGVYLMVGLGVISALPVLIQSVKKRK